jgi:carbamoyl-phosphate synthase large subunit
MSEGRFKSYGDLEVWQLAMALAKLVYESTATFPSDERFGLVNQMRRAAVSIPSNSAEGHARGGPVEFQRFIMIAMGSVAELETQVLLSLDLGFLNLAQQEQLMPKLDQIGKLLRGLHRSLARRSNG